MDTPEIDEIDVDEPEMQVPVVAKKRGRPPKALPEPEAEPEVEPESAVIAKKRGRPPKLVEPAKAVSGLQPEPLPVQVQPPLKRSLRNK